MKINKIYIPILFFSCIAIGIFIGGFLNFPVEKTSSKNNYKIKINKLIDFIDNEYVDNVKTDSIVDKTVNNILAELDPHSVYVTPKEQNLVAESMKGDFVGIGVNFFTLNDTITVVKPIENGPSAKAGIKSGDRILYANKSKLFGKKISQDYLYSKLKGEKNSPVTLTIYRKSENKTLKIKVIRDVIPLKSVDVATVFNNTGYIKINRFSETTATEFHDNLAHLKEKKITSLIIDLRENGGGYLEKAVEIADELLKNEETIVVTKNKKGKVEKTLATDGGLFETGKILVLIDENSASASEVLAGAIQDNDRGTIVGRRSFGKGLVQREMNFDDGSAVRLTIARYYTPSGRSIQKPYKKGEAEKYFNEFETRFESGELYEKDKIKIADSLKFKTKKGRIVYGGGGIVPDVFVPITTQHGQESLEYLLKSGAVSHFVFEQLDKNPNLFNKSTYNLFIEKFKSDKTQVALFEKFLSKSGLKLSLQNSKEIVNRYISAEFARQLFGEKEYYSIILPQDKMIQKALSTL
jgi:carboxyl-terminal processing protease